MAWTVVRVGMKRSTRTARCAKRLVSRFLTTFVCSWALSATAGGLGVGVAFAQQSSGPAGAESELQAGIALTQQGRFSEALPHLLAARGRVADEYAAGFDLALCYFGTGRFGQTIQVLTELKNQGHATPDVNDLLAQAYVATAQPQKALEAFREAIHGNSQNEIMYLFVADACLDHQSYELGIQIVDFGLQHLPRSARLRYERGVFFSLLNQPDLAKADYDVAARLASGSDISYMAEGQAALLDGDMAQAIRVARDGIRAGHGNYVLLTILGSAIARAGMGPETPEFAEGRKALEQAIAERPSYPESQIALGELCLSAGQLDDAVAHLEKARELAPSDPAVYSHLAMAYRQEGRSKEEQQALAILAALNQEQAQKYKQDSPDHKAGYAASGRSVRKPSLQ